MNENNDAITLASKEILCPSLYESLKKFSSVDDRVNENVFVLSYLGMTGFYANNKIRLEVGTDGFTIGNMYLLFITYSGRGKTFTGTLFTNAIHYVEQKLLDENELSAKFAEYCRNSEGSFKPDKNIDGSPYDDEENSSLSEEEKNKAVERFNKFNGTDFTRFKKIANKKVTTYLTDFTPEKLAQSYNESKNNTIFLFGDEFQNFAENFSRGKNNVKDGYTNLTQLSDPYNGIIGRVSKNTLSITNATLSIQANTTPSTFKQILTTPFYSSGLGYRFFYFFDGRLQSDPLKPTQIKENANDTPPCIEMGNKIKYIAENYFYNMVYSSEGSPIDLVINENETLSYYNELVEKLEDLVYSNGNLNLEQKESMKYRLKYKFKKCILNVFVMNYSWDNYDNWKPIEHRRELTKDDIYRGFKAFEYFLDVEIKMQTDEEDVRLTNKQMQVVSLIPIGGEMNESVLRKAVIDKDIMSRSAFHTFITNMAILTKNGKNPSFLAVYEDPKTKNKLIKRLS